MRKEKIKTFVYIFIASLCFVGSLFYSINKDTKDEFLQTSVLTILKSVNDELKPSAPIDLAITDVNFEKIYDPTPTFNYYKYSVDLTVKNNGATLVNANVVISGDHNQKSQFVRNTKKGFYLQKDGIYVIKGYEVIFDGNFNGGSIALNIDAKDRTDIDLSNNFVNVDFVEFPPKLSDVSLKEITDDKSFVITFENEKDFENYKFEAFVSGDYSFPEDSLKYAEVYGLGKVYGYYRTQNNGDILSSKKWQNISVDKDDLTVKFSENLFSDLTERYLYLKATDKKTGFYLFSNVIKFPGYHELSAEDLVKFFDEDESLEMAVSGYLNRDYSLAKTVTRGEALKIVSDSLNIKLPRDIDSQYFEDISPENYLYPYSVGLKDKNLWKTFGNKFNPNSPATIDYLKYLVYEYTKNR